MIDSRRLPFSRRARLCLAATLAVVPLMGGADTAALAAAPDTAVLARATPAEGRWGWPIEPPHRIHRGFEAPQTRYSAGHRGVDIIAGAGAAVRAPTDAEVYFSGTVVDRPVLTLQTAAGVLVSLEPVIGSVSLQLPVRAGEVIGSVGSGGHCDQTCVHLGVRVDGAYVSPLLYLGGAQRAILLPLR